MWSLCFQMSLQRATFMLCSNHQADRKAFYDVWSLEMVSRIYARAQLLLGMWCCEGQHCKLLSQIMCCTIFRVAIKKIILLIGGHHKGHLNKQYKIYIRAVCDCALHWAERRCFHILMWQLLWNWDSCCCLSNNNAKKSIMKNCFPVE